MKISIITPTYNSSKTIRDTLESIKKQTYKDFEVICVDGASIDDTLAIVSDYKDFFAIKIVSEKDAGIYDAMNKGINLASGDIIHILNSDDLYFTDTVLEEVVEIFSANKLLDMVYGDIRYFDGIVDKTTRLWIAGEYKEKNLSQGWIIPHPGLFVRAEFYEKTEKKFDIRLRIAADYEFILRSLKIEKANVFYLPKILVSMRAGGTSRLHLRLGWKEKKLSWGMNGLRIPSFFITKMLLGKIRQIFNKI